MAHTKGPWKLEIFSDGVLTVVGPPGFEGDPKNYRIVCDTVGCEEEDESNAQLIIAAPDMYDALRWLVNISSGVGKAGGPPEAGEFEEALTAAKNVLAKAEGQAL